MVDHRTLFVGMVDVEEQSQILGIEGPCMKGLFTWVGIHGGFIDWLEWIGGSLSRVRDGAGVVNRSGTRDEWVLCSGIHRGHWFHNN